MPLCDLESGVGYLFSWQAGGRQAGRQAATREKSDIGSMVFLVFSAAMIMKFKRANLDSWQH